MDQTTSDDIASSRARIDAMTREQMARMWRFSPLGKFPFTGEAGNYFIKRFAELGGWSPELSKQIGWETP